MKSLFMVLALLMATSLSNAQPFPAAPAEPAQPAAEIKETVAKPDAKPIKARYANEAVEVWDSSLEHTEVNYSNSVALKIHYKNNTDKKVIGISVHVKIINPFGKTVYETTYDDESTLEPMEMSRSTGFWHFDENRFLGDTPYSKMWLMAQNGTGKIETKILKVIFADGSTLISKPIASKSAKKAKNKKI